jgi:hypothetical protein
MGDEILDHFVVNRFPAASHGKDKASPTKGHAQKVLKPSRATGAILGKALGLLEKGKGKIPV